MAGWSKKACHLGEIFKAKIALDVSAKNFIFGVIEILLEWSKDINNVVSYFNCLYININYIFF